MAEKIKLHVGCGTKHIPGYINIDCQKTIATDLVLDIANLPLHFKSNSIDTIYACHVLEHFPMHIALKHMSVFYDLLKPGGILRLAVPNFEAVVERFSHTGNLSEVFGLLYSHHEIPYDGHYAIWDYKLLSSQLSDLKFSSIQRYNWWETEHAELDDFSQAYMPHMDKENGILMSLNVEAIK